MITTGLKVLMVAAEMVPFAKTGGLADVIGALPAALRALGHDVRVALPRYSRIDLQRFDLQPALAPFAVPFDDTTIDAALLSGNAGDTPVYFVDNDRFFARDGIYMYDDDADRYIFFCRAVLEALRLLDWVPDVIHCHDWHTAIIPNWLKTLYRDDPLFQPIACVYTIHNLAYQGVFGHRVLEVAGVDEYAFEALPERPQVSEMVDFMSRGIFYADLISTVSETYAAEILDPAHGEGLDTLLRDRRERLFGVLNGIDVVRYDPATDLHIAATYDADNLAGKILCKAALQGQHGLTATAQTPLIGIVSRLTDQKGFDLLAQIIEPLLRHHDVQFAILGTGDRRYHDLLSITRARFPQQLSFAPTFNAAAAQQIYAGADLLLMPSRSEPCGQSQMVAMRYGTIPIVRATGGLADTVTDYDATAESGDGFVFVPYEPLALFAAIVRAIEAYRHRASWQRLITRAMAADHSWDASARRYVELYQKALALR